MLQRCSVLPAHPAPKDNQPSEDLLLCFAMFQRQGADLRSLVATFPSPCQEIQKDAGRRPSRARSVTQSEQCWVTRLTGAPAALGEIRMNRVVSPWSCPRLATRKAFSSVVFPRWWQLSVGHMACVQVRTEGQPTLKDIQKSHSLS